jgi:hypothetical protein
MRSSDRTALARAEGVSARRLCGFVASSGTGAIVSATVASSDLSLLSVGGVFRTSFVIVLPRLCYGAAGSD